MTLLVIYDLGTSTSASGTNDDGNRNPPVIVGDRPECDGRVSHSMGVHPLKFNNRNHLGADRYALECVRHLIYDGGRNAAS